MRRALSIIVSLVLLMVLFSACQGGEQGTLASSQPGNGGEAIGTADEGKINIFYRRNPQRVDLDALARRVQKTNELLNVPAGIDVHVDLDGGISNTGADIVTTAYSFGDSTGY